MREIQKEKLGGTAGDKGFEYYYVGLLATAPKYQGQGYGSTLLNSILFAVRALHATLSFTKLIVAGGLERAANLLVFEHT